jgi:hypothetical protein
MDTFFILRLDIGNNKASTVLFLENHQKRNGAIGKLKTSPFQKKRKKSTRPLSISRKVWKLTIGEIFATLFPFKGM